MSKRDVTTDDLSKVKGLGPLKAEAIHSALKDGAKTAKELAAIQGVSTNMAEEVVKLAKDPDKYKPQAPTPRKRATTRKAAKSTLKADTNGDSSDVSARSVRLFAREAESFGLTALAENLRAKVASLVDEDKVPLEKLNV